MACSETSVAGLRARGEIAWLTLKVNDPAQNPPPPPRRSAGLMVVSRPRRNEAGQTPERRAPARRVARRLAGACRYTVPEHPASARWRSPPPRIVRVAPPGQPGASCQQGATPRQHRRTRDSPVGEPPFTPQAPPPPPPQRPRPFTSLSRPTRRATETPRPSLPPPPPGTPLGWPANHPPIDAAAQSSDHPPREHRLHHHPGTFPGTRPPRARPAPAPRPPARGRVFVARPLATAFS